MSFSSELKEELSKLSNLANKEVVKFEFLGYLATDHVQVIQEKQKTKLKFSTENEYNINRYSKLLNNLQITKYEIQIVGRTFVITALAPNMEEISYSKERIILNQNKINEKIEKQENLQKAFIRGNFLGSGSMNNPQRNYHLEVAYSNVEYAKFAMDILKKYNIIFKYIAKVNVDSIYTKDGNQTSKFLAFIGANNSMLKFEDIRVYRDVRNNVNRKVNCETANLNKTVNSALKQIEAIKFLQEKGKLKELSEGLQEIAKLRIEHPEATLAELGTMLEIPLGKSGVNHRLKAIEKMAEECHTRDVS